MGMYSDLFSGRKEQVNITPIVDKQKTAVANPLSSYLASSIGKGVPRWQGNILPTTDELGASVSPFLSKTVGDLYSDVERTAMNSFKNTYADSLEGYAGALSSSGRAYNDKTLTTELALGLAEKKSNLELQLPAAQYAIAAAQKNAEAQAQYQDWLKSLPEYNPVLDKALAFLNDQTSSGTTWLTSMFAGQKAGIYDIIKAGAQAAAAAG